MKTQPGFHKAMLIITIDMLMCMAMGCTALRPQAALPADQQKPLYIPPTLSSVSRATSTPDATNPLNSQQANCTNELDFISDLTVPDGTFVEPGATVDKQWDVKNTGTCNWNETYSVRLTDGPDLGAASPQSIPPLRAGVEGVIRIIFTAPNEPGKYTATWQAFGPDGKMFGEYFSININVVKP